MSFFKFHIKSIVIILQTSYAIFTLCSTLLFRSPVKEYRYDYHPFWSYKAIIDGKDWLIEENALNILLFVPIGIFIGIEYREITWKRVVGIGFILSITIEILQLVSKRGFSEFDDVIHNTLGALIGYFIWIIIKGAWLKVKRA